MASALPSSSFPAPLPLSALLLLLLLSAAASAPASSGDAADALLLAPDEGAGPLLLARLRGSWDMPSSADAALFAPGDFDAQEALAAAHRVKRTGSQALSIVAPLDVLRQRLLLELNRRRMRESEGRIEANRKMLTTIGKRVDVRFPAPGALWGTSWDERFAAEQA